MKEAYEIAPRENRQGMLETMDIGATVSISRRIELQYGFAEGAIAAQTTQLRGTADQQTHRARRRCPGRKFKVENGSFMTRDGALIITAAITRVE